MVDMENTSLDKNDGPATGPATGATSFVGVGTPATPSGAPYGPDAFRTGPGAYDRPWDAEPEPATAPVLVRPRLTRSRTEKMLGGVCGGAGRHLDVDPTLLRLGLVLLTVFGAGVGVLLYLAAWILVPLES